MIKIVILISFFLPTNIYADELNADDALAATIKTLARVFVQTMDIEKIKAKHIKTLLKMDELKFHQHYREVYGFLKDISPESRVHYGLTENMSKEEAINDIRHLDKNDLMQIIDGIPDQAIIRHVKDYLKQTTKNAGQNPLEKIDSLWGKMIKKA